jgi:ubiquinone/menaquinone biosynthesis C-methylase UbiE
MISKEYKAYIKQQSKKTLDPVKRKKWLGEEWQLKINGFKKEFGKFKEFLKEDKKCLCLGARTGQEVVALKQLGIKDVIGIDIVPCKPHVIEGDIHNLDFDDNTFDFVYTNIIDHSINPKKMISEVERVLKTNGIFFLQIQLGLNQDEYTVFEINNPIYDIVTLFNKSFCLGIRPVNLDKTPNFAGMNVELIFRKDVKLNSLYEKWGNLESLKVPEKYNKLWENINLPIQNKKLDASKILEKEKRSEILSRLSKRAYYLTRIADVYNAKNILEVGTAEGWQFFSFGEYAKEKDGLVISCDPRDVRSKIYSEIYQGTCYYFKETSKFLGNSNQVNNIDLFYIDGLHDEGTVIEDVINLLNKQNNNPVWIFDDFDIRFGCFNDIVKLISISGGFKVWKIGLTASGQPSHQVMVNNRFKTNEN